MILHRVNCCPRWQYCLFFFFFTLNLMHCSSTVQTPYLQLSRCSPLSPQVGSQGCEEQHGVDNLFLSLQWERENKTERERKRERDHPSIFPLTPPRPNLGLLQSRFVSKRKEEGQAKLIKDQWWSVYVLMSDQEQWVGPAPPLPYTYPSPHPPFQSSRTCRQRWPPLALHCQRMMQQRHRRWPPPCTEGGGVTGAK